MAHVAGFVAGFACGYVFHRRVKPPDDARIDQRASIGMGVSLFVVGSAFVLAGLSV
jgi:hypothetical protein